jgi:hypothetical protein
MGWGKRSATHHKRRQGCRGLCGVRQAARVSLVGYGAKARLTSPATFLAERLSGGATSNLLVHGADLLVHGADAA